MTMNIGKAVFPCPIDGQEVALHDKCINCKHFKNWGFKGARPYVTCDVVVQFPQKEVEPEKAKAEEMSGLRRW